MKDYKITFKALIQGIVYLPGKDKKDAVKRFKEELEFDEVEQIQKIKVTKVEEN